MSRSKIFRARPKLKGDSFLFGDFSFLNSLNKLEVPLNLLTNSALTIEIKRKGDGL
jgi:hypothetical protein